MDYITFPWEQLGQALRRLSLSGSGGNVMAWILFFAIGALPLAAAVILLCRHRSCRADFLLPALSAALFVGLWFFINPSYMDRYLSPMPTGGFSGYALAGVIYSLFLTWALLRFLLRMEGKKTGQREPLSGLRVLLDLYALILAAGLMIQGWDEFRTALTALQESNSGSASYLLNITTLFLALRFIMKLLPGAAQVALLLMISVFLRSYENDPFGPRSCQAMERLKIASRRFLIVVLAANVSFNVLQLVFSRFLLTSHHQILLPLPELIVILGIRTLSFLYLQSRQLKEDNDMFI